MAGPAPRNHSFPAAFLSAALALVAAGCANSHSSHPAPSAPEPTSTSTSTSGGAVPGRIHVKVADVDLTITDAVAHLDRSGDGSLSMSVRNDDDAPEHLGMVATPGGGRGVLVGGKSAEGNGSLSTAGILLLSGTTVTFGTRGPRILLHQAHVTSRHTLPVTLQFGVAGMVRLQARVTSS
ncbi:hypothetical protein RKE30_20135 [Streptomyces sp. Li-HN-5-11]|uniref:hypothetical protein n=1 Tax=Streptomyces sp. Li-HN-5-11 TaxID=3075432 RepID=UPI0028AA7C3A|nr:hypothetical protein [Streptomyces sp. Li-HN-5-11]WNM32558.1 hypothetical protein RKE30_20135 [Streptomyces sp. Li-HN-5-11]